MRLESPFEFNRKSVPRSPEREAEFKEFKDNEEFFRRAVEEAKTLGGLRQVFSKGFEGSDLDNTKIRRMFLEDGAQSSSAEDVVELIDQCIKDIEENRTVDLSNVPQYPDYLDSKLKELTQQSLQ